VEDRKLGQPQSWYGCSCKERNFWSSFLSTVTLLSYFRSEFQEHANSLPVHYYNQTTCEPGFLYMTEEDVISVATEQRNEDMYREGESEEQGNSDHVNGTTVC
jgi:hypothetical protein